MARQLVMSVVKGARSSMKCVNNISGQEFQCDRLSELEIVRPIHFSHAPASQPTDDAITSAEEGAGRKAAMIDGARRGEPA